MAVAAHSFGGLDLCNTYPEKMPPGIIDAEQLPKSSSRGANLVETYCEQCHYLPGPGRHTAVEWHGVLKKMNILMDVSNRFGNLMGKIKSPTESEREIIEQYLVNNALIPMEPVPEEIKGHAYERHCGSCHALPDPAQHTTTEWKQVIQRMLLSMEVMKYSPPNDAELTDIENYLKTRVEARASPINRPGPVLVEIEQSGLDVTSTEEEKNNFINSALALGPFVVLVLIGLARWFVRDSKRGERSVSHK